MQKIDQTFRGVSDEEKAQITSGNVAKLYGIQ